MATGGAPSPDDWKMHLTCPLCLDIFTDPKMVPGCNHTYCLKCLEELVSDYEDTFPCPECRAEVTIPDGGIATFQTNRFLRSEDMERARDGMECPTHPKMEQDMYCVNCNTFICPKCVLENHKFHTTKEVHEAAREAKVQLMEDLKRLQDAESYMAGKVEAEEKEHQSLRNNKTALKTAINNRRAVYISKVNKIHDDMLADLDVTCSHIEADITKQLNLKQKTRKLLSHMKQQAQQAVSDGTPSELLNLAKDMKDGRGSPQAVDKLKTSQRRSFTRPVVIFKNTQCAVEGNIEVSMQGTPGKMESTSTEVNVKEQLKCGPEQDTEVFSLCPLVNGNVWVSFARKGSKESVPCEEFLKTGKSVKFEKHTGRATCKATIRGESVLPRTGGISSASKSPSPSMTYIYLLHMIPSTLSKVVQLTRVSGNPSKREQKTLFNIRQEGPQRAFDVNSTQQLFVVLDDTQAPERRRVHLYLRDEERAVATYTPPSPHCQPSDVCFMALGGEEVLLVSDEATDSIHVVRVQQDSMTFLRYLAPGCPLLKQPTALNTDFEGRLWVACRGGAILTMTPMK